MLRLGSRPGIWAGTLLLGARIVPRWPVFGFTRLLAPASYWRSAEFAYVARQLDQLPAASKVLDIGSPKELACLLALHRRFEMTVGDIVEAEVALAARLAEAAQVKVASAWQDARELSYASNSFDAAYSVSVIEHIPNDGDSAAIREMVRVTRPGGRVVLTVPFAPEYAETWVDHPVYERLQEGGKRVFYQRHYDEQALRDRLIRPSQCEVLEIAVWGEGAIRGERILDRLRCLKTPFVFIPLTGPIEPLLSMALLNAGQRHPMAAFITLRKQG